MEEQALLEEEVESRFWVGQSWCACNVIVSLEFVNAIPYSASAGFCRNMYYVKASREKKLGQTEGAIEVDQLIVPRQKQRPQNDKKDVFRPWSKT